MSRNGGRPEIAILGHLNVNRCLDASGREIDPIHESLPGLIRWANVVLILLSIPIRSH